MSKVGIIANPSSGKDIRRLIASGSVVTNQEKINIVTRMIASMDAGKVDEVWIMPDLSKLGKRIIEQVTTYHTKVEVLELPVVFGNATDTKNTVLKMVEEEFDLIIVMGGDGTCRIVAKYCNSIPLIAVSTGTNNVFPEVIEGTLAGMAAAAAVDKKLYLAANAIHHPILEVRNEKSDLIDIALVDLVLVDGFDKASGAVWDEESIKEVFLTKANSDAIGLSSIGGCYCPMDKHSGCGLNIEMGKEGETIIAPIAPGLMKSITVKRHTYFSDNPVSLKNKNGVIALDGEKELVIGTSHETSNLFIHFKEKGPRVLDIQKTLSEAARAHFWKINNS